ncbi:hypothetical protein chiPu_0016704 [Chiloscyllium punctatum]|uniref:Uncharacterized protein n=1 Tax=Chiloscyllium punctatum TaxID=137246 RepID=A0A401T6E6_CHIPU|nr:hypothetical protein [Chiloscyllium punctatum]
MQMNLIQEDFKSPSAPAQDVTHRQHRPLKRKKSKAVELYLHQQRGCKKESEVHAACCFLGSWSLDLRYIRHSGNNLSKTALDNPSGL